MGTGVSHGRRRGSRRDGSGIGEFGASFDLLSHRYADQHSSLFLGLQVGNMVVALLGTSTTSHGQLTISTPPSIGPVALQIRAQQVKLLAAANAVARLTGGFLSDLVAPVPLAKRRQGESTADSSRRWSAGVRISRLSLLIAASIMALGAYTWAAFGLTTTDGLPAFSIIVGISYGLMFTLVPAVTVSA